MFTLDEINKEVDKYINQTKMSIPYITNIDYKESNPDGLVLRSELIQGKYIIHLNPKIHNYNKKYQKSILWHEFTHIYDYLKNATNKQGDSYMKSVSEINSTEIEIRYLLDINSNQNISLYKEIIFMTYKPIYKQLLNYYLKVAKRGLEDFISSKNPKDFDYGITNIMYLCGASKVIQNGKDYLLKEISIIPDLFQKEISNIIKDLYDNQGENIPSIYSIAKSKAFIYGLPC